MGQPVSKENNIQARGRLMSSKCGAVMFRNQVGSAWQGIKRKEFTENGKRYIVLENPRNIDFGLTKGSGDTIGWKSVTITTEMVGQKIAQFTSIEYKTETGRASDDQKRWDKAVRASGGLSGFARNDDDVREILGCQNVNG